MRLRKTIPVTALFFVGASMTLAQDTPATTYYPDDAVRKTIDLALRNIEKAKCGSAACAPATQVELANPPLAIAERGGGRWTRHWNRPGGSGAVSPKGDGYSTPSCAMPGTF
jgi:hypothetical protein